MRQCTGTYLSRRSRRSLQVHVPKSIRKVGKCVVQQSAAAFCRQAGRHAGRQAWLVLLHFNTVRHPRWHPFCDICVCAIVGQCTGTYLSRRSRRSLQVHVQKSIRKVGKCVVQQSAARLCACNCGPVYRNLPQLVLSLAPAGSRAHKSIKKMWATLLSKSYRLMVV